MRFFQMVLDFMTNLDYNMQADNLKCKQPEQNVEKSRSLVERARLEIVYTPQGYRGFESLLLRQIRTVILIQSVSGLRFLLFGKNGVFAALLHPAAPKENPARLFSWSGFCLCVGFVVLVIVERA